MNGRVSVDDILGIDPDWTGGMTTDEYIAHTRDDEHREDPDRPFWCVCGLAGMYETPDVWVCYASARRRS